MDKIDAITELKNPQFIKPILINYTQKGFKKTWEAVVSHDSVSILLYHKEKDAFVLVKQLRPAVLNANHTDGDMYELCAGIVDKELSNKEIAKEEILEECGYDVPLQNIQKISSFYTSVGISGAEQTLYFAEINKAMKSSEGGGLAEEEIEVIYLPVKNAKAFMFDEKYKKTPGVIMAFYWFFDTKREGNQPSQNY
jgi:UDP-sugar diphosphatase